MGTKSYFRCTERVVHGSDGWYYLLRDGEQLGPFSNRESAKYHGSDVTSRKQRDQFAAQDIKKLIAGEKLERLSIITIDGWDQIPEVKRAL
ncbi:MAG: DUF6316 family protein [Pseudomonadota bacterium]